MKLPAGSIKIRANPEKLFLAHFFEDDTEISVPTLLAAKQKKGESIKTFVERFRSMALYLTSGMTQLTLVEMCRHNLQSSLLAQMGVAECCTWKQLCYKANRHKRLSPGSGLKKKTTNQDPTSHRNAPQSVFLAEEKGYFGNRGQITFEDPVSQRGYGFQPTTC